MAVDGREIGLLQLSVKYKIYGTKEGSEPYEQPGIYIHFYDDQRRDISDQMVGPWLGTSDWKTDLKTIPVPLKAREMIIRIGLNGATGELWVDDLRMSVQPRK